MYLFSSLNFKTISFEVLLVSDQLKVVIGYNYDDVNVKKTVADEYGRFVDNKMG